MALLSSLVAVLSLVSFYAGFAESAALGGKAEDPTARVKNGTLVGRYQDTYKQDFFLGIPYAQPPTGDLRLRNPASLNSTFKTKDAKEYSPICVGYGSDDWGYDLSEDCLTLNVIRPSGCQKGSQLPVAVWIHGGGFFEGGSADRRYNLSFIVQNSAEMGKPIIGISINYRLAQWGFLAGDDVQEAGTTNLGLKDQRLALHWIQENIKAFGGDEKKVTIWGESAGGGSVAYQATLFGGRDDKLFRGIIAESTYVNAQQSNKTQAEVTFQNVTRAAGCSGASDPLQCLREVPYNKLNDAFNVTIAGGANFGPVTDGDLIKTYTTEQLNSGQFAPAALLIGANTDEGTAFGAKGINTTAQFAAAVASNGPDAEAVAEIEKLYPDIPSQGIPATLVGRPTGNMSSLGYQYKRASAFGGDLVMHSVRRQYNQQWAKHGVKSYAYRFNARSNGLPDTVGVTHFQEVAYVFNNTMNLGYGEPISAKPFENRGEAYLRLAKFMSRSWVAFVHDLDPNGHGVEGENYWPEYSKHSPQDFVFDANVTSYAEHDTYRQKGIQFIIDNSISQFNR